MTVEWCFVRDSDGRYYINQVSPDVMVKGKYTWCVTSRTGYWIQVLPDANGVFVPTQTTGLAKYLDLSKVPIPKWEDEHPIVIVQNITQTYYTID